ncbi:MAG: hypothetical protein J6V01_02755, partial [Clostridia bacterium]|nr:hypothetical protein [Clostridia bacterium]
VPLTFASSGTRPPFIYTRLGYLLPFGFAAGAKVFLFRFAVQSMLAPETGYGNVSSGFYAILAKAG